MADDATTSGPGETADPAASPVAARPARRLALSTAIFSFATAISRVLGLFREVVAKTGQPMPTLDEPLLDSAGGVIDSVNMWPLIVFIESHFGIQIEDTDIMQENFQTLRALAKFVETKHVELHS